MDGVIDITRDELVRILGAPLVERAEALSEDEFQQLKWDRLTDLLRAYEKVYHTPLFEGRRTFLLGLDENMKLALVRHIFDQQFVK